MFDRFGREINYLRISVTDRCNLRCTYCMPAEGITLLRHEDILSFESIAAIARSAVELGLTKIRLTGGEPLARKGLPELVSLLAAIPGLETLALTTTGTLLARFAAVLRRRGLDSVNISLDTLDAGIYAGLTRGGRLADALAGIEAALAAGLPVKLTAVQCPGAPADTRSSLQDFATERGLGLQFIRQYRLDETRVPSMGSPAPGPVLRPGLGALPAVSDTGHFDRPPPCAVCNRLRLLANGRLKTCLHSDDLLPVDPGNPRPALEAAILAKPRQGATCTSLAIGQIGG